MFSTLQGIHPSTAYGPTDFIFLNFVDRILWQPWSMTQTTVTASMLVAAGEYFHYQEPPFCRKSLFT